MHKSELYRDLRAQAGSLLSGERDLHANAANLAALVFYALPGLNWAGFYFLRGQELVLGPFQGKVACVRIALGAGVCGTAAARRDTLIVADVHTFPGHIACDADSRAEIVVPLIHEDRLIGVLDVDSPLLARFDAEDGAGLEGLAAEFLVASDLGKAPPPTLYQWAGGIERIQALFAAFYARVPGDPVLAPIFAHMSPAHFRSVAHFVAEVLGGPKLYSGDGVHGHSTMVAKHLARHLTDAQRRQWMILLLDTADRLALPDDPEFRSALVGYLEWGSRLAVSNSARDVNPIGSGEPMPRWGWGEVRGPYTP